jgi:hypothetical protein
LTESIKRDKEYFSEFMEWLGISFEEALKISKSVDEIKEWKNKKDIYDFHKNSYYFIFTLLDWEKTTKSVYTDTICDFINKWPHYKIKTVLDHGTGIGYDAIRIIEETGCDVYLNDLNSPHLAFAIWRLKKRNLFHKVKGILIPTKDNPLPDFPMVDFTTSIAVIEHLEEPQRDLKFILDRTKYMSIRVDPVVDNEDGASSTHIEKHKKYLERLNGQDKQLLAELGLKRINYLMPVIYEVERNVEPEYKMTTRNITGDPNSTTFEYIWTK